MNEESDDESYNCVYNTYDIFKKDSGGNPVWVESVMGFNRAKKRLLSLQKVATGEYMVFDPTSGHFLDLNVNRKSA